MALNIATEAGFITANRLIREVFKSAADGDTLLLPYTATFVHIVSARKLEAEVIGMEEQPVIMDMLRANGWLLKNVAKK